MCMNTVTVAYPYIFIIIYFSDVKCEQNGTIVFVAFDQAQTCTCHNFTCCYQGSQAFIKQFTDELGLNKGQIEGAVILDSIMNFDRTPNIQNLTVLDQITDLSIRNVIKQIQRDGNRGDFLMAIGRQDGDNELLKNLTKYYNKGPNYRGKNKTNISLLCRKPFSALFTCSGFLCCSRLRDLHSAQWKKRWLNPIIPNGQLQHRKPIQKLERKTLKRDTCGGG